MGNVILIGPSGSGKTNLFIDLETCARIRGHGFDAAMNLEIKCPRREERRWIRRYHESTPGSTQDVRDATFEMYIRRPFATSEVLSQIAEDPAGEDAAAGQPITFKVRDAPGEWYLPSNASSLTPEELNEYETAVAEQKGFMKACTGIVLVQAAWRAHRSNSFREILDIFEDFVRHDNDPGFEFDNLENVVIAINMFDLWMVPYGNLALEFASDPGSVRQILRDGLREARRDLLGFHPLGNARHVSVRIVAVSSFGFLPEFGCPNIDPEKSDFDPDTQKWPQHFAGSRHPYMVVEPFVFAAIGLDDSPFLFTVEDLT